MTAFHSDSSTQGRCVDLSFLSLLSFFFLMELKMVKYFWRAKPTPFSLCAPFVNCHTPAVTLTFQLLLVFVLLKGAAWTSCCGKNQENPRSPFHSFFLQKASFHRYSRWWYLVLPMLGAGNSPQTCNFSPLDLHPPLSPSSTRPFVVKSSHTPTKSSRPTSGRRSEPSPWGAAAIHACWMVVPAGAEAKSSLSGEGICSRWTAWFLAAHRPGPSFDVWQSGLVDVCLFFQPLLLKTD